MTDNSIVPEIEKYPVGKFLIPSSITSVDIERCIQTLEALPLQLRREVGHLSEAQLDTPYREGGWTIRQVIHHVPESHLNAYCRFKLALTEDHPTIRPYMQDRWSDLPDGKSAPIGVSLDLLDAVHRRWVLVLRQMSPADFSKTFYHPEGEITWRLDESLCHYEWHSRHHLAHITGLKKKRGWK